MFSSLSAKTLTIIIIFSVGVVYSQPPPDFVDDNNYSEEPSTGNEIQRLYIGIEYQCSQANYESFDYNIETYSTPDFYYEAERNLINSKKMDLKFNENLRFS